MKRNFNELFSKMKPESQERVKARSSKLLQEIALADQFAEIEGVTATEGVTPSTDANATSSDEAIPANRKVALQGSK
ncbi:MAG TPA: hypothetical protein VF713_00470 [Thermoanaerobaculia bacterium]